MVPQVSATQLKARLDTGDKLRLIDVREPHEWDIARIEGAELIPLRTLPDQIEEWDTSEEFVLYCRTGVRSAQAVELMLAEGFGRVSNLTGGIWSWSDEVDPSIPKY